MDSNTKEKVIDDQFFVIKRLGRGYTSKVYLAEHRKSNTKVALKIFKAKRESYKEFKTEIDSMQKIKSSNVLIIYAANNKGIYTKPGKKPKEIVYIGIELAENAELFDFISEPGKGLPEKIALHYFHQLINGVKATHSAGYVHRDLKTENIFLDSSFVLKIGDFGFAKTVKKENSNFKTVLGTVGYQSPELLEGKGYDGKSNDVFACGVILFILSHGYPPFKEATKSDPWYKNIYNGNFKKFWEYHLKRIENKSESLVKLLSGMLDKEGERVKIEDIEKSEWYCGKLASEEEVNEEMQNRKKIVDAARKKHEKIRLESKEENKEKNDKNHKNYRNSAVSDSSILLGLFDRIDNGELTTKEFNEKLKENGVGRFFLSIDKRFEDSVKYLIEVLVKSFKCNFEVESSSVLKCKLLLRNEVDSEIYEEEIEINIEFYLENENSTVFLFVMESFTNAFSFKMFKNQFQEEFQKNHFDDDS